VVWRFAINDNQEDKDQGTHQHMGRAAGRDHDGVLATAAGQVHPLLPRRCATPRPRPLSSNELRALHMARVEAGAASARPKLLAVAATSVASSWQCTPARRQQCHGLILLYDMVVHWRRRTTSSTRPPATRAVTLLPPGQDVCSTSALVLAR
jgi:hypothetical protein